MGKLVRGLGIAILWLASCGGGTAARPDAARDSGNTATTPDGGAPACANLACLKQGSDLMFGCGGGGSCVLEQDATAPSASGNQCYDNGVKIQASAAATPGSTTSGLTYTYKVKKGDALCYTRTLASGYTPMDGGLVYGMDSTLQDAAGATVVTAHADANDVWTVTCPGKAPAVFVDSCGYDSLAVNGMYVTLGATPPSCTQGSCSF
jgi:hypothetical protein